MGQYCHCWRRAPRRIFGHMANVLTLLVLAWLVLVPAVLLVVVANRCGPGLLPPPVDRRVPICHHYGGQQIR